MKNLSYKDQYKNICQYAPYYAQRPLIGITGNFGDKGCELAQGYYKSIEVVGGIPIVLPPTNHTGVILSYLSKLDGIVLSGGGDINPICWDEDPIMGLRSINNDRDMFELILARLAYDRQIPILGICRGMQVLACALGGKVYQDIYSQIDKDLIKHSQDADRHVPTHYIYCEKDSIINSLLGTKVAVNSFHHQSVKETGPFLKVTARSSDGIIEALESNEYKSILGVQFHPETFILHSDNTMLPVFEWLVEEGNSFLSAKNVHNQVFSLDSHVDTPMFFDKGICLNERNKNVLVDMHKLNEGKVDAVIMVAYLPQGERTDKARLEATLRADTILDEIVRKVEECKNAEIVYEPKNALYLKKTSKKSIFLGIENGYAIGTNLDNIEYFRRKGVVYMTLCHNGDNDICDSAVRSKKEHGGLSSFGREVVMEMNRTGMMIDLSHASVDTFYDVLKYSKVPPVCSHSSAYSLCKHPRNLTDEQIIDLATAGGVVQVTFYHGFLNENNEASIFDVVRHLIHMVELVGVEAVGIGSDFDGDGGVRGLASESEMINLTRILIKEGFTLPQLRKIWGGNFLRVMTQVQQMGSIKF